ncbi:MAG: hypothetical protein AB1391_00560 [Candidatus Micrarchaeota archaeon]
MLTYSELREIQKKEIESFELVKVEKDFYSQLKLFIESKKACALKNQSFDEMREFENAKKIVRSIITKRREKISMLFTLQNQEIEGLANEERLFLAQIRKIASESFEQFDSLFLEPKNEILRRTRIKIVKTLEAYKGFDNNIYGPYKEGEEIFLPEEEAEWLLKNKMAEHISN